MTGRLVLAYFLSYVPYAMAIKALSIGMPLGSAVPENGLVFLPAVALGQLVAMSVFLTAIGWWRYSRCRRVLGRRLRLPGADMLVASCFTALVIATTTLNLTFAHVSVLLMLLLMRGGVLALSPLVDLVRRHRVGASSWVAVCLSLVAVAVALRDVDSYALTGAAAASAGLYVVGYLGRFVMMSRLAKTGDEEVDRRYFVEEHAAAPVVQITVLAAAALAGQPELRAGFATLLTAPAPAAVAVGVGVLYQLLFVFGTLIYLDRRAFTWCVPANRCASLLAGVVASYGLHVWVGLPLPGPAQLLSVAFILGASVSLSAPAIAERRRRRVVDAVVTGGLDTDRSRGFATVRWQSPAEDRSRGRVAAGPQCGQAE